MVGLKKMKTVAFFILLGALLFSVVPLTADARGLVPCGGCQVDFVDNACPVGQAEATCGFCHIFQLINNIIIFFLVPSPTINHMAPVVPLLATLFILIGGFYILIAGGSPVEVFKDTGAKGSPLALKKGKEILGAVVTGLLIVYIAWVVVMSILSFLGVAAWTGLTDNPATPDIIEGWWDIKCG
jgi:hypothetical protein